MKKHLPERRVLHWIRSRCRRTDAVLDVGCGEGRYSNLGVKHYVGVDSWPACNPSLILNLKTVDLPFAENTFDVVLMIDFVEHLEKYRSRQLIEQAKEICSRELLVMTPIAWDANTAAFEDPEEFHYQNPDVIHKSIWEEADFDDSRWKRHKLIDPVTRRESNTSKLMLSYIWEK